VVDPGTGQPFPGNVIPASRIDSAATYFLPILLKPNSGSNRYIANAGTFDKTYEYLGCRSPAHQQSAGLRTLLLSARANQPGGYLADPKTFGNNTLHQSGLALNYTWMFTPRTLLTVTGGYMRHLRLL